MDYDTLLGFYLSWDYDTIMASFNAPGSWVPAPEPTRIPARRLSHAIGPLAEHAIMSRKTNEQLAKLGLNFCPGYIWGRCAFLGEPSPAMAAAAFPAYEPRILGAVYEEGRRHCGRAGLLAAREEGTVESLREILGDADVTGAVDVLRRGLAAAQPAGRPLFAGLASLPWPTDPLGRLWRACELLHMFRGDGHVAVWTAEGLTPVAINLLTELWLGLPQGVYTAMRRGWSEEAIGDGQALLESRHLVAGDQITEAGRRLRDDIEDRTDALDQPIIDAIGPDFDDTVRALSGWSGACAGAGAYPPGTFTPDSA